MKLLSLLAEITIPASKVGVPTQSAADVVVNLMNVVYYAAGAVAVLVIMIMGFMMVVQGNNPEKIGKRKKAITMASIGLIIILVAFTLTQWIAGVF